MLRKLPISEALTDKLARKILRLVLKEFKDRHILFPVYDFVFDNIHKKIKKILKKEQ